MGAGGDRDLFTGLGGIFTKKKLDADTVAALEEALIRADMGVRPAKRLAGLVAKNRYDAEISEGELRAILAAEIASDLSRIEKPLLPENAPKPFVVLVAGVNGTGKTTTIGKLARNLTRDARAKHMDVLLIDTAGRLQNKTGLMAELEKIARVLKKLDVGAPHAVLLVLDATTGQNAISQVEAFSAAVPLTGLVMTKLDGTAKGGILVALAGRFGLPVHYIGVGEGEDDLQPFVAADFANALVAVAGEKT